MKGVTDRRSNWITSTAAGFKATREYLGLEVTDLASLWGINPLEVESWETGGTPIPDNIAWHLVTMTADFEEAIENRAKEQRESGGASIVTSQWDGDRNGEYAAMPARWHRAVDRTAAVKLDKPLVYPKGAEVEKNIKGGSR